MPLSLLSKKTIILIIAVITWIVWLTFLGIEGAFCHLINYWIIALTMLFG